MVQDRLEATSVRLSAMERDKGALSASAYRYLCGTAISLLETCGTVELFKLLPFEDDSTRELVENVLFERLGYLVAADFKAAAAAQEVLRVLLRRLAERQ